MLCTVFASLNIFHLKYQDLISLLETKFITSQYYAHITILVKTVKHIKQRSQ